MTDKDIFKMTDEELDELFPPISDADLAKLAPAGRPDEDVEIDKELMAKAAAIAAEKEAGMRRWVASGFKVGGHLLPSNKKIFDQWVLRTLKAAAADPIAASSRVEKLTLWVLQNQANIRRYAAWQKQKRSGKRSSSRH